MSMDLTGITNKNEYYTNHYFSTVFEENTRATISGWNAAARESEEIKTPWSLLRQNARQYYTAHDKFVRSSVNLQVLANIKALVGNYLKSLGYPEAKPEVVAVDDSLSVPVYLEMTKSNGAPLLWVLLSASKESDAGIMESFVFNANDVDDDAAGTLYKGVLGEIANEDLVTKILFGTAEPPRFVMLIGMNQIALIDRNKWNEKRYLQFELEEIFSRLENTTLQAMSVLLHKDSLCPDDGKVLLDELDEQSQKNASGVSQDLKYALRESIELLGNEVLYDMKARLGRDLDADPVDAGQLTLECLRYMYRMLFVLFIESRPELGYAPIKAQSYYSGYSLESLRDIADNIRDDVNEVGDGYYLHETLAKLYELIYDGYPKTEDELKKATGSDSLHDMFLIAPLKAHIFDPEYTKMITAAKLRNSCMLRIIDLMSLTRATGRKNGRRGRISYVNLGINQMGAVYEALLSYRGFIAEHDLYEVKRAGDSFNELDVGYFVSESELEQYTEDERVRYESGEKAGKLRMYEKGTFIYRLAGREREKSASYYTPEVLTKCLVKHALKELLEGKTADEILKLTICEPAMGSAAFLNEAINQLAEAYISRKEKETGEIISYEKRFNELQKVKMFIADRNVYGIDLNPVAVELAEVSLWLNTIYEGGFVPWFGTQLVNGNSLIGARRQVYRIENAQSTSKGLRWYEMEPDRVPLGTKRMPKKQVYHFLLGDPGMCSYTDKVIKQLEPANIKEMKDWNKKFTSPFTDDEVVTLLRLSAVIDELWEAQIQLRKEVGSKTQDALSNFRVWSLSFKDVQSVFAPQGDFYTTTLEAEKMPSGKTMYQNMIKKQKADVIEPARLSSFDLLLEYLKLPDAERVFKGQAYAYSLSLLEPALMKNNLAFNNWEMIVKAVNDQTHFTNADFVFLGTIFGSWIPRTSNAHLAIHSAILASELKAGGAVAVCAVLNDEKDRRTDKYEQEWNGLWRFYNVMQFSDEFIAVSSVGMSHMDYLALPVAINADSDTVAPVAAVDDAWNAIKELLFDDDAKAFVEIAKDAGVPAPDEDNIGYEVEGGDGEVVAAVEIAWPDRRIGFMTAEQAEDKEKLEKLGWRILNLLDAANMDVASYFGGDNQ